MTAALQILYLTALYLALGQLVHRHLVPITWRDDGFVQIMLRIATEEGSFFMFAGALCFVATWPIVFTVISITERRGRVRAVIKTLETNL